MVKPIEPPKCVHCNQPSRLVSGRVIFPNNSFVATDRFYLCDNCEAHVGTSAKTGKPTGLPANEYLRNARKTLYNLITPIWKDAWRSKSYAGSNVNNSEARMLIQRAAKSRVYHWLSTEMNISKKTCKISMFGLEECREAYRLCRGVDYEDIRAWHKAQPASLEK